MDGHKRYNDFAEKTDIFDGEKVKIKDIIDEEILILGYKIKSSKYKKSNSENCMTIHFTQDDTNYVLFTGSAILMEQLEKYQDEIPFLTTIKKIDKYFTFS